MHVEIWFAIRLAVPSLICIRNNLSNGNGQHELVEAKRALDRWAEFKMRCILLRVLTHGFRYGLSDREGIIRYTGLLRLSRGSGFLIPHFLT